MDENATTEPHSEGQGHCVYILENSSKNETLTPHFEETNTLPHLQDQMLFFEAIEARYNCALPFATTFIPTDTSATVKTRGLSLPLGGLLRQKSSMKRLRAVFPSQVSNLVNNHKAILIDVRSFIKYSQKHIQSSINIAVPNTILRRTTFTLKRLLMPLFLTTIVCVGKIYPYWTVNQTLYFMTKHLNTLPKTVQFIICISSLIASAIEESFIS